MPRQCSICNGPNRAEIERATDAGESTHKIAARLGTSASVISRHNRKCREVIRINEIADASPPIEAAPLPSRFDVYSDLVALRSKAVALLETAEQDDNGTWTVQFAMKELRGIATDMVKVYEAQKRIETMYQPKETFSTSEAFSFLRDNYPEALSDMMRHLGAG